jgi:hypothetical protein
MDAVAIVLLAVLVPLFVWAWWRRPGQAAAAQFVDMWRMTPWGKQVIIDFFALETVLALWMLADAASRGAWLLATACIVAMPLFGAMPAALYWLAR